MSRLDVNVVAVGVLKTILAGPTEQNAEVVSIARRQGVPTVEACAIVAFDFAEALVAESKKRGYNE